jgi:hypothetical protein
MSAPISRTTSHCETILLHHILDIMKLRIVGNSLRLRVSKSEHLRVLSGQQVSATIQFAPDSRSVLTYRLEQADADTPTGVQWAPPDLTILLSASDIQDWRKAETVGVYATLPLGEGQHLALSVEKDFACRDGSDDENNDAFENPLAGMQC